MRWRWWCGPTRHSAEYGGHIATYASSATLYEVGFNHFWRAPERQATAAISCSSRGTPRPGIYARAYLEGRLTEEQLGHFRREVGGKGLSSYPHPVADAGVLAVSDRVHGPRLHDGDLPGAVPALPRASRPDSGIGPQGLVLPRRRRDGRAGVHGRHHHAGAREARQPDLRHQLQPAATGRPGARQRQDHPGAGSGVRRRRLERHQGAVGLALGSAARRRRHRDCCAASWKSPSTASTRPARPSAAPTPARISSASTRS